MNEGLIGVAVVGTGFGCRIHVPALRAAGFFVRALVGQDPERTRRRADRLGIDRIETSLAAALDDPEVVAVSIATPPGTHAALAIEAARAGRHVLCEKPFAVDAESARAMLDAVTVAGVVHLVGHEFRWAEDRVALGAAIAAGRIGEPRLATIVSYVPLMADPSSPGLPWWFDAGAGGGWLGASGSHVVDQVRTWLGEFTAVRAGLGVTAARDTPVDDTFTVFATVGDGVDCVLQQTGAAWGPMTGMTRVAGTLGTAWIDDNVAWCADRAGAAPIEIDPAWRLPVPLEVSDDPRHRYSHLELGPYTRLAETFRARIEGRVDPTSVPAPTFSGGVASMLVLDAIRASAAAGGSLITLT